MSMPSVLEVPLPSIADEAGTYDGRRYVVLRPCLFCGYTTGGIVKGLTPPTWTAYIEWDGHPPDACVGNGNGRHIFPGEFPPEVIAVIKKSRGIA